MHVSTCVKVGTLSSLSASARDVYTGSVAVGHIVADRFRERLSSTLRSYTSRKTRCRSPLLFRSWHLFFARCIGGRMARVPSPGPANSQGFLRSSRSRSTHLLIFLLKGRTDGRNGNGGVGVDRLGPLPSFLPSSLLRPFLPLRGALFVLLLGLSLSLRISNSGSAISFLAHCT